MRQNQLVHTPQHHHGQQPHRAAPKLRQQAFAAVQHIDKGCHGQQKPADIVGVQIAVIVHKIGALAFFKNKGIAEHQHKVIAHKAACRKHAQRTHAQPLAFGQQHCAQKQQRGERRQHNARPQHADVRMVKGALHIAARLCKARQALGVVVPHRQAQQDLNARKRHRYNGFTGGAHAARSCILCHKACNIAVPAKVKCQRGRHAAKGKANALCKAVLPACKAFLPAGHKHHTVCRHQPGCH